MKLLVTRTWFPLSLFLLWHFVTYQEWVSSLLLPTLDKTWESFIEFATSGELKQDTEASLTRFAIGYSLAALVGIPTGMLLGTYRKFHDSTEFVFEFFRSTPVTAFFPLFLLLFGANDLSKIAMIFASSIFIIILNSSYGVRYSNQTRINIGKLFAASKFQQFIYITFWEALPQIFVGLRISLSIALIVTIVSEMLIGSTHGLGQKVFDSYTVSNTSQLYVVLLLVGIIGYFLNKAFQIIEKSIVHWS